MTLTSVGSHQQPEVPPSLHPAHQTTLGQMICGLCALCGLFILNIPSYIIVSRSSTLILL